MEKWFFLKQKRMDTLSIQLKKFQKYLQINLQTIFFYILYYNGIKNKIQIFPVLKLQICFVKTFINCRKRFARKRSNEMLKLIGTYDILLFV